MIHCLECQQNDGKTNNMKTKHEPLTDEARELHERNQRALDYLDKCEQRMENDLDKGRNLMLGCIVILILNSAIWYAIYCIVRALGEL